MLHEGVDDIGLGGQADSRTTGHAGGRLACGEIKGNDVGCTATPSSQPIVGRQCQDINVLGQYGTTAQMVLGRERESEAVCMYVPCRTEGYAYPLIVLLHGYGSNGTRQEMYERFAPMADGASFSLFNTVFVLFSCVSFCFCTVLCCFMLFCTVFVLFYAVFVLKMMDFDRAGLHPSNTTRHA